MRLAVKSLHFYWAVVTLYVLVLGWWMIYFSRQGDILVTRVSQAGTELTPGQAEALREATDSSLRMLMFEGGFLGFLLLASAWLVVRASQRELRFHRQQKNFLSAVTHELRSPIASARLYLESLELGRVPDEKRGRYLKHAREDLDRLRDMVDQLLQSARMTDARPQLDLERLDLAAFAEAALPALARDELGAQADVRFEPARPAPVRADTAALETILRNLLSNAGKYGGDPPRVVVAVEQDARHATLKVRDFGPGLNGTNRRRIFGAFVRGGDENVRTHQGVGLGLFMVAELARAMGGRAEAHDDLDQGGGLAVSVKLPLAGEAA